MSTINAYNLELQLVQKINSTTNELELLALASAVKQLQNSVVFSVQYFSDLPLASSNIGALYFVIIDKTVYISYPIYGWVSLSVDPLSTLWTWGSNGGYGLLGDGTTITRSSPATVVGGDPTWCQVSLGCFHASGVKTDGTLWTWGDNSNGKLGNGSGAATVCPSPATTAGGGNTWCQTSSGGRQSVAVKTDGTLWTWGYNSTAGTLGTGTTTARCSPGTTAGGGSSWCQSSAGNLHTSSLKLDGTLWTWGSNSLGRLGDGTTVNRSSPVTTAGGGTTWCQTSAGDRHTTAVKTDGTLWTWGYNRFGRLGTGTTVNRSSPGTTAGGGTTWRQTSTGWTHTGAIKTDGTLWTWGYNLQGRLGDGTVINRCSPVTTSGGGTTWCQIGAGYAHNSAVKTDGTLWTWGYNGSGRLGDGTTVNRSSPSTTAGGGTNWCQTSANCLTTAAIQVKTT